MTNKLVVILFFLLLTLPALLAGLGKQHKATGLETSNRLPVIHSVYDFFSQTDKLDAYNKSAFPFRRFMMANLLRIRHRLKSNVSRSLYTGKNEWLFTDLDNIVGLKTGTRPLNTASFNQSKRVLNSTYLYFKKQGKAFYITVAPNKHSIEQEQLPGFLSPYFTDSLPPVYVSNLIDGIPYIDLFGPLRQKAIEMEEPLYFPQGTHWNTRGGFEAFKIVAQAIQTDFPGLDIPSFDAIDSDLGAYNDIGLARQLHVGALPFNRPTTELPLPCPYIADTILLTKPKFNGRHDSRLFKTGKPGPRLVIIGDSFTQHNLKYYLCSFSEVLFVHHRNGGWDKKSVDAFDGDVVLFEFVERYVRRKFTNIFTPPKKKR